MPITGVGAIGSPAAFVVEADIPANDRRTESLAGAGDTPDSLREGLVDIEVLRRAEVQAVGHGHRPGAGADHVARGLGDGDGAAVVWIELAVAPVAVRGQGDAPGGTRDAQDGGVAAGRHDRVREHLVVVLAEHLVPAREVRPCDQLGQGFRRGLGQEVGEGTGVGLAARERFEVAHALAAVGRRVCGDGHGDAPYLDALIAQHHLIPAGDLPDLDACHLPALEERGHVAGVLALGDDEHAFLALGEHDLVGGHARLTAGHAFEVEHRPRFAARTAFEHGTRKPGRP